VTCKLNERYALNTKLTKTTVEENNIVVLKADMTHDAPDIEDKLIEFGNTAKAIPYYAVYRPDSEPHHFDGNFLTVGARGFLDRAGIEAARNPAITNVSGVGSRYVLDYQPFSKESIAKNVEAGKTVLVQFTADWDFTSKLNEKYALNTLLTKSIIDQEGIVVLKADMTDENPEAKDLLGEFGNSTMSIPYYAVFRAGEEPHHFDGNFTGVGAEGFLERAGLATSQDGSK